MTVRQRRPGVGVRLMKRLVFAGAVALAALMPVRSYAQNITYSEFKFGIWDHDTHAFGGKERGADINPEVILASPIADEMLANAPPWLRWALQPRPTIGAAINTAGDTDQFYLGANWAWMLARNIIGPEDGIFLGYFFGPGFNDGKIVTRDPNRKSLGSHILFREALDFGYQINPLYSVSLYIDHISNGGLAKQNQSINDLGVRFGVRF